MKPFRSADASAAGRIRKRAPETPAKTLRECLVLGDPTDCLLDAYDCVAMRAYENYLANGPRPGGELEDWLSAERELLLGSKVDLHETDEYIYALAGVPGATASRTSVAIESRWMVIVVREPTQRPGRADSCARDVSVATISKGNASWEVPSPASVSDATRSPGSKPVDPCTREKFGVPPMIGDDRRAKSVCVLGLPASVDGARSVAVLADGLLGIRMAKVQPGR